MMAFSSRPSRSSFLAMLTGAAATLASFAVATSADALDAQQVFTDYCVQCHGENGQGSFFNHAPPIGGQHEWYVLNQLTKFRSGVRGQNPKDVVGMKMYAAVRYLKTEDDLKAMAAYVGSLPVTVQSAAAIAAETSPLHVHPSGGDAARGQPAFATCVACHGPEGQGMQQLNAPRIAGLSEWYVLHQLQSFKAGLRGGDPVKDPVGMSMRAIATTLDDQTMQDVAAYVARLPATK
jgi:cytochrome c553